MFENLPSLIPPLKNTTSLLEIRAPFDGSLLGTIPACDEVDVELAVNRARRRKRAWDGCPFAQRAAIFLAFMTCCSTVRTRCWT